MDPFPPTDVLAQPTRARLYALLQRDDRPVDTAHLAREVGLHPNGVRTHLEQMEAAGLVTRLRAPQARGRPRALWRASPAGVPQGPHIAERTPVRRRHEHPQIREPGSDVDYRRLAELRAGLRGYLAWAEAIAREHDLTAAQFQLALAVYASPDPQGPTLTELSDALLLRHHSVVGLVDRAQDSGLVERIRDPEHPSRVHVVMTSDGARRFRLLADQHLRELAHVAPSMQQLWAAFSDDHTDRD